MSQFFKDVGGDLTNLEEKVLGPKYDYAKNIKTPGEIGMSSRGSISAAAKNVAGLIDYTEVLVTGILIRWIKVSPKPMAKPANPLGAFECVAPKIMIKNMKVITISVINAAVIL